LSCLHLFDIKAYELSGTACFSKQRLNEVNQIRHTIGLIVKTINPVSTKTEATCHSLAIVINRSGLTRLLVLAILLSVLSRSLAVGSVFYTQGQINSQSDILNTGTFLVATDLGPNAPAVTVNGVAFGPDSPAGLNGWSYGTGDFSTQFQAGSPLDKLLSDLDYQSLNLGSASLTLSGLTPGQPYLLQLFLCDQINATAQSSRVIIQGQSYNISPFGTNADYIRATFTASGTSEVIQFGTGDNLEPDRMILNAFAVSAVPEPDTWALLALGAAAMAAAGLREFRSW
jgi:hypothetical protein